MIWAFCKTTPILGVLPQGKLDDDAGGPVLAPPRGSTTVWSIDPVRSIESNAATSRFPPQNRLRYIRQNGQSFWYRTDISPFEFESH
jgi:hypothetical protein